MKFYFQCLLAEPVKPKECNKPKLGVSGKKICCSCPDTRKLRDLCAVENGPENCKVRYFI